MKHISPQLVLLVGALLASQSALAASPHFVRGPTATLSGTDVIVSWKEAGLGDTVLVTYEASADATAVYQCVNQGGNCPAAANKQSVQGPVGATGTFSSGKNGTITQSLQFGPPASTLNCPGNQVRVLVSVVYTDIALASSAGSTELATPSTLGFSGPECP